MPTDILIVIAICLICAACSAVMRHWFGWVNAPEDVDHSYYHSDNDGWSLFDGSSAHDHHP
jgi:uncharacterized protein YceK